MMLLITRLYLSCEPFSCLRLIEIVLYSQCICFIFGALLPNPESSHLPKPSLRSLPPLSPLFILSYLLFLMLLHRTFEWPARHSPPNISPLCSPSLGSHSPCPHDLCARCMCASQYWWFCPYALISLTTSVISQHCWNSMCTILPLYGYLKTPASRRLQALLILWTSRPYSYWLVHVCACVISIVFGIILLLPPTYRHISIMTLTQNNFHFSTLNGFSSSRNVHAAIFLHLVF